MVDWSRDEVVLVADVLVQNGWRSIRASDPRASELSERLRAHAEIFHPGEELPDNFRSVGSVQRKMEDLRTADPEFTGVRTRGGRTTAEIAALFRTDPDEWHARAATIWQLVESNPAQLAPSSADGLERDEAEEGGILERVAIRRERDRRLRARKLEQVRKDGRPIACEVCGFDFAETYGERGEGYIEVHHVLPLYVSGRTTTRLDDLALLCANCHRMCHRQRGNWLTPEELRTLVESTAR